MYTFPNCSLVELLSNWFLFAFAEFCILETLWKPCQLSFQDMREIWFLCFVQLRGTFEKKYSTHFVSEIKTNMKQIFSRPSRIVICNCSLIRAVYIFFYKYLVFSLRVPGECELREYTALLHCDKILKLNHSVIGQALTTWENKTYSAAG